ncbi:hypothetical protein ABIC44_002561 [Sphingomonas sp. 1185]
MVAIIGGPDLNGDDTVRPVYKDGAPMTTPT